MEAHEDDRHDGDAAGDDGAADPAHDPEREAGTDGRSPDAASAAGGDEDGPAAGGAGDGGADDGSERLSEEIREELEELDELRDRHLRLAAEFENYRKRTRRELKDARERGQADLADRLLEALDDLERVLETPEDSATVESLQEGVEMVQRKLEKELSEAGLARMDPEGERFDPEYHEALLTAPTDDPDQNDVVSRVLINGYVFGERVLRPARVEVMKYSGSGGDDGPGADEAGGTGPGDAGGDADEHGGG